MEAKLQRIRELIDERERIDDELAKLIDGVEKPKRTRRTKAQIEADRAVHLNNGT